MISANSYMFRYQSANLIYIYIYIYNVLLTVHLSTFTLVINQLDAQNFVLQ